jgi:hypothetical protein
MADTSTELSTQKATKPAETSASTALQTVPPGTMTGSGASAQAAMQRYLDKALSVLEKFGGARSTTLSELTKVLEEVRYVDEPKVLAIAKTIQHMSDFNSLVRENVENINVGNRYLEISQMFDSIREDSKTLISQLEDGKISLGEKTQNLWMMIRRGSPGARFDKIAKVYTDVARDTKDQLVREQTIMDGYIDFRFALKEAEVLAREVAAKQLVTQEAARAKLAAAQKAIDDSPKDGAAKVADSQSSRLQLARDEARAAFDVEDRNYQLLKDVAENLAIGYDVGDTLITKLKQTHDVKDQVYRRAIVFFTTNEHVFTILGTVYTSQQGLHEATQSLEAMKTGVNKGLEDVAELGRDLERAAIRAGYGSTINPASVQKLVDAISEYQVESLKMVAQLRQESEANAKEIRRVVETGKKKYEETLAHFAAQGTAS